MELFGDLRSELAKAKLKITPQRIGVLGAVKSLNHPSVEHILDYIL